MRSATTWPPAECDDKAGAYAIQGRAAQFVVELSRQLLGRDGLPLFETAQTARAHGAQHERRAGR
jgi:septum formation protein